MIIETEICFYSYNIFDYNSVSGFSIKISENMDYKHQNIV